MRRVYCHCPWPGLLASIFVSSYPPGNDHISHLATRKIIDLKVPAGGRGYVIVQLVYMHFCELVMVDFDEFVVRRLVRFSYKTSHS